MTLNPNYEAIGKAFTEQYYLMFDNPATRSVRSITFLGFFFAGYKQKQNIPQIWIFIPKNVCFFGFLPVEIVTTNNLLI